MNPDFASLPPAVWLRGKMIGLRAVIRADAGDVDLWYEGSPPLTPDEAEARLVSGERIPWGNNPIIRLMIVSLEGSEALGGVVVTRSQSRTSDIVLTVGRRAANREEIEREALGLIVPWLLNEVGLMTVKMRIPADESSILAAATLTGMREAVRLREYVVRDVGRADLLIVERVNRQWGRPWKAEDDA